jgi:hypothetical protein
MRAKPNGGEIQDTGSPGLSSRWPEGYNLAASRIATEAEELP